MPVTVAVLMIGVGDVGYGDHMPFPSRPVPEVLRWEARRSMPWRNGTGTTHQIACAPADASAEDFDWRLSLAEVSQSGGFSAFPGIDRIIMLLDGKGMSLTLPSGLQELHLRQPFSFAGEDEVACSLRHGATRDLNVMTRRGVCKATLAVRSVSDRQPISAQAGQERLLVVLDGVLSVTDQQAGALDCLYLPGPTRQNLEGHAVIADILLTRAARSRIGYCDEENLVKETIG